MKNIEFSITGDGRTIMVQDCQTPRMLTRNDHETIKFICSIIESRYPDAYKALFEEYGHLPDYKYRIVIRFIKCNFGNDDEIRDIDETGSMHFEHVRCPLRGGDCLWEDTICHPKEHTQLTPREMEVAKAIAQGLSLKEVAVKLHISVRTVEAHRDNIYLKLEVQSQSQLTNYMNKHNLK